MPYIKQEKRKEIDKFLDPLIEHLKKQPVGEQDGDLNYAITKMVKRLYPRHYLDLNRALGVLSAVSQEFYRRVVGPHEDVKIKENGDVE